MKLIASYLPSLLLAFGLGLGLWGIHWVLIGRHLDLGNERKFPRQLLILALGDGGDAHSIMHFSAGNYWFFAQDSLPKDS